MGNGRLVYHADVREHFESKKAMGALHQGVMRSFREYMLVLSLIHI